MAASVMVPPELILAVISCFQIIVWRDALKDGAPHSSREPEDQHRHGIQGLQVQHLNSSSNHSCAELGPQVSQAFFVSSTNPINKCLKQ
eukprot:5939012-Amphidinium_carterae.1